MCMRKCASQDWTAHPERTDIRTGKKVMWLKGRINTAWQVNYIAKEPHEFFLFVYQMINDQIAFTMQWTLNPLKDQSASDRPLLGID